MEIRVPTLAYTLRGLVRQLLQRVRAVQQRPAVYLRFVVQTVTVRHPHADVMADNGNFVVPQVAHQLVDVGGGSACTVILQRFFRGAEPSHIGHDNLIVLRQNRDLLAPGKPHLRPTMQQNHRETVSLDDVVDVDAVDACGAVGEVPFGHFEHLLVAKRPPADNLTSDGWQVTHSWRSDPRGTGPHRAGRWGSRRRRCRPELRHPA